MAVKFALAAAFVFNKEGGTVTSLIQLGFAFVSFYIVYKRVSEAVIFVRNIYYGAIIYETLQACILIILPAHSLANNQLTIVPIVAFTLASIVLGVYLTFLVEMRR